MVITGTQCILQPNQYMKWIPQTLRVCYTTYVGRYIYLETQC